MRTYDESLKVYWDNYNSSVIQTAKHEGANEKALRIVRESKKNGVPNQVVATATRLPKERTQDL